MAVPAAASYCYSFPWCTVIKIRSVQPIRSFAGANASRYREGSGRLVLAARCNSWTSSTGKRHYNVCRFRAPTARCRGSYGSWGTGGVFLTRERVGPEKSESGLCCGQTARDSSISLHRHHRKYCAALHAFENLSPGAAMTCHSAAFFQGQCSLVPPTHAFTRPPHYGQSVGSQSGRETHR